VMSNSFRVQSRRSVTESQSQRVAGAHRRGDAAPLAGGRIENGRAIGIFQFAICILHFSFVETPRGTANEKRSMKNAKCK
jgi:hypothetical protein